MGTSLSLRFEKQGRGFRKEDLINSLEAEEDRIVGIKLGQVWSELAPSGNCIHIGTFHIPMSYATRHNILISYGHQL